MVPVGSLASKPRYQPEPARQSAAPKRLLKRARISPGISSSRTPARLLASAVGYQVLGNCAPGKSATVWVVPAEPRTAESAAHASGSKLARILMLGALVSVSPQILAASLKALRRCWPRVV